MLATQLTLLGRMAPAFDGSFRDAIRTDIGGGGWIERVPGFLQGHELVFDVLHDTTGWNTHERTMYDRVVEVPRLTATLPSDGDGHPVIDELADVLSQRYGERLTSVSAALYRDGEDSVAWHGDRHAQTVRNAMVATVSLGEPRRFLMRPKPGEDKRKAGATLTFNLGWGDLMVMGGDCQHSWEHAVPKSRHPMGPRISVMFRNRAADAPEPADRSRRAEKRRRKRKRAADKG